MKKKYRDCLNLLMYLLIFLLTVYIAIIILFPTQFKNLSRYTPFIIVTDSMEPKINVNSLVLVDQKDNDDLKVDDIITFRFDIDEDGDLETITHRVAKINDYGDKLNYHTKAENSDLWDNWILDDDNIVGKVVLIIPFVGYAVLFINRFAFPIVLFLNIFIWLMIIHVIRNWSEV